jgi:putative ABC transport system permease protein
MKPNNLTLRISGNNIPALMDFIKKSWSEACPDYPFQFNFYDSWFESMYKNEEGLGKLISLFALLSIVISITFGRQEESRLTI